MAIAFDANANGLQITGGSTFTLTYSHTCTGSNRILFVSAATVEDAGGTPVTITGVTYNGVALTQIGTYSAETPAPSAQMSSLWYLIAPATGANNVAISSSVNVFAIIGASASYTGAAQSGQPDAFTVATPANTASFSQSATVVATGCWLMAGSKNDGGAASAGSGTTARVNAATGISMMDSNGTVSTGSQSLVTTFGGSVNWVGLIASFKPVAAGGGFFGRPYYDQIPQGMLNV